MNPDRLAELEEERRFLLRSIRDIEREHAAGDVDDTDFHILRDGYVARTAAVLGEIEDGRSAIVPKRERSWQRRTVVVGVTLLAAVGLGVFVALSAGQRLPGQSLTGGQPADEVAVKLSQASQVLMSDSPTALKLYDEVLAIEPDNVEALTYKAWLFVLAGRGEGDMSLIEDGIDGLRQVVQIDDSYADAHCFLAVATGRFLDPPDEATAIGEGEACLASNPPGMFRNDIEQIIAELSPSANSAPTTT